MEYDKDTIENIKLKILSFGYNNPTKELCEMTYENQICDNKEFYTFKVANKVLNNMYRFDASIKITAKNLTSLSGLNVTHIEDENIRPWRDYRSIMRVTSGTTLQVILLV